MDLLSMSIPQVLGGDIRQVLQNPVLDLPGLTLASRRTKLTSPNKKMDEKTEF